MKDHKEVLLFNFLAYLSIERGFSKNTTKSYKIDLMPIIKDDNCDIINCSASYLDNYLLSLKQRNSDRSIARKRSAIRHFFNFLYLSREIKINPSKDLSIIRYASSIPKVMDQKKINQIIDNICYNCDDCNIDLLRLKLIVEIIYGCGLRVSELINIKINDFNFKNNYLHIKGKGNKERIIPINKGIKATLCIYIKRFFGLSVNNGSHLLKLANEYLLQNIKHKNNKKITRQRVAQIIKRKFQDLKISAHSFRHMFASHLLENKMDIKIIQSILGHENLSSTQVYTHVLSRDILDNYNKLHPLSVLNI